MTQPPAEAPKPAKPPRLPFELQDGEYVLVFCRRHWLYVYPKLVGMALVAVLGPVLLALVVSKTAGMDGTAAKVVWVIIAAWAVYWAVRMYFTWFRYHYDIWVVTNQRIVDSIRRHWFHHQMASADLVDVEDIRVHKEGVLPTMFNFGDVRCQTAAEQPNFILAGIPRPADVLGVVDRHRDAARRALRGV
ncbi:MAG: hypothetical protein HY875_05820 [Chloroflexi bacterium]|nr:hypothetical protein [Chloroflexota bacterium]